MIEGGNKVTYYINVKVENGEASLVDAGGTLPDGKFAINGHDAPDGRSITVNQYEPDGWQLVGYAQGYQHHYSVVASAP